MLGTKLGEFAGTISTDFFFDYWKGSVNFCTVCLCSKCSVCCGEFKYALKT